MNLLKTPHVGLLAAQPAYGPFPGPSAWWQLAVIVRDHQKAVDVGMHVYIHTHTKTFFDSKSHLWGTASLQGTGVQG